MKKLMIAVAGLSLCAAVHSESVTSDNVVGYMTVALTKGNYNTMTVQFNEIGKNSFSLNDITLNGMTASDASETADMIQFWNPETSGYVNYYYYTGDDAPTGWYNVSTDDSFDDEYPSGLPVGTAFWYYARGTGTGTGLSSGEVESADDVTFTLTKGNYNLIASAYPSPLKLNAMILNNMTASDASETADMIQFWNPETSGYVNYYYYTGDDAPTGWYNVSTDDSFDDEYPNGMSAGTAFWYFARGTGSGTIKFEK